MISGDRVGQIEETISVLNWSDSGWHITGHACEEGWQVNVSGVFSPGEEFALGCYQVVPSLISCQGLGVEFSEQFRGHVLSDYLLDFVTGRPNVL